MGRPLAVRRLNALLRLPIPALSWGDHPLDHASRPIFLLCLCEREQLASSDSEFFNPPFDYRRHVHDTSVSKGIQDLVTVLAVDLLPITVLQGDLDRDIRLKLNLIAHLAFLSRERKRVAARDDVPRQSAPAETKDPVPRATGAGLGYPQFRTAGNNPIPPPARSHIRIRASLRHPVPSLPLLTTSTRHRG